jgi:hypothetical protein
MPDRQITYGADATDATYRSGDADPAGGGNFVVAEDLDGSTVLLEWDGTTWQSRGPVEMNGNDITGAGSITASGTVEGGTYTVGGSQALISVAGSGSVTLSSGTATVDTGLSATDATFYLALGVDDPNADVNLAGKLFWDDSAGTYKIGIDEVDTSVGNPTANYDVLRVR